MLIIPMFRGWMMVVVVFVLAAFLAFLTLRRRNES
jgi:hypothetical protein